ncbi:uncharacterized protein RSE6_00969 [Rhynchosporium secalis]|uniref:C3H1-type domain-containing protein n=1 Tax=Rhynchosporium secalis TaxID=38038 RepID=A0A1E1LWL1_RHYSE|nr:uncharacterized protein RSE6_00969 [Rhynchosporium secalis]
MSDQDLASAIVPADGSSSPAPTHILDQSNDLDTEMTYPLTLMDSHSISSGSPSPDTMSTFQDNRGRNGQNLNQGNNQGAPYNPVPGHQRNSGNRRAQAAPLVNAQAPYNPNMPNMNGPPPGPPQQAPRSVAPSAPTSVPLSTVCPGSVHPTENQLNTAYGYAIRRGENSFTRLLPADQYPMTGVPALQGAEGLIILPPTVQPVPNGNMPERMVPLQVVMGLPPVNIPFQPARPLVQTLSNTNTVQARINAIVQSSSNAPTPARRREKVYCDKWIHEGTCAFTQLGCKYLHRMPMDRETQMTLGLNNGPPAWYRRTEEYLTRPMEEGQMVVLGSPVSGNRLQGPWRRNDGPPAQPNFGVQNFEQGRRTTQGQQMGGPQYGSAQMGGPQMGGISQVRGYGENSGYGNQNRSFGPIAPPGPPRFASNNNVYGPFKTEKNNDEDEMLFKARQHF